MGCNPTCVVACRALCWAAVQKAQREYIPYVYAAELLIKSTPEGEMLRGGLRVRVERNTDGALQEHSFDEAGYDIWGYDRDGRYEGLHDRAPFQRSPFPTEHTAFKN